MITGVCRWVLWGGAGRRVRAVEARSHRLRLRRTRSRAHNHRQYSGTRTATAFRRPRRPFSCPPRSRKLHNGGGRNSPLRRPALAGSPAPARPACALPMDSAQPAVAAPAPAPAAVAAAAGAAIASPPVLVLVMVDGGQYVVVAPLVLRMHRTDLLKALRRDFTAGGRGREQVHRDRRRQCVQEDAEYRRLGGALHIAGRRHARRARGGRACKDGGGGGRRPVLPLRAREPATGGRGRGRRRAGG